MKPLGGMGRMAAMGSTERRLRGWVEQVRDGRLPRRGFIARLAALGVSAPMAGLMLMNAGIAAAPSSFSYAPAQRGGGGTLKLLYWQGPTLLNPHFATGQKDQEGSRLFYESLALWDAEGQMVPLLAAEVPSRTNGGVAADGKSVTWKLKPGVTWHDGRPFSADDVVFNWRYATDPATAAVTRGEYAAVQAIERLDALTVRVLFDQPTPFWPGTYSRTQLLPRHVFEPYIGARSREAPANLKPVGTGPYRFLDFKPGDLVRGTLNPHYHQPGRPHFDSVEIKGGGDAVSAARAVLQTGEFDYAWNLQAEDQILRKLEATGKGRLVYALAGAVEFISLNWSDPHTELDGERAHPNSRHPLFADAAVREAIALLIDRQGVQDVVYGRAGIATANIVNNPPAFRSPNTKRVFSIEKANALLEAAGWKQAADGVRAKDGKRLQLLFQTSTNSARQKTQAIVKGAAQKAGIAIELKSVAASVFFSSDIGNPDTMPKFWADMQMFTNNMGQPDPARFMDQFTSWQMASKANKWQGTNNSRWRDDQYDRAYRAAQAELDPVKRAALFIRMNDLLCSSHHIIPLVHRPEVAGLGRSLRGHISGWDLGLGFIHDWYREAA